MAVAASVIGLVIGVAGGVSSARSQRKAGKAAKRESQLQSAVEFENAQVAAALAARDAEIRRIEGQKLLGRQAAVVGASGATAIGSFQDIAAESARIAEFEAQDIEFAGQRRREDFQNRASQFSQIGRGREAAAKRGAVGTLLSTGSKGAIGFSKLGAAKKPIKSGD